MRVIIVALGAFLDARGDVDERALALRVDDDLDMVKESESVLVCSSVGCCHLHHSRSHFTTREEYVMMKATRGWLGAWGEQCLLSWPWR